MKRMIKVKYLNIYYTITRKKEEFIEFNESLTLRELVDKLSRGYKPEFRDAILDGENKLKPHAWILVNGELAKNLEMKLKDEEVIVFSLPITGG